VETPDGRMLVNDLSMKLAHGEGSFCKWPKRFGSFNCPGPQTSGPHLRAAISLMVQQELRKITEYDAVVGLGCFQFFLELRGYMEYNGDVFRHYVCNYSYKICRRFYEIQSRSDEIHTLL